MTTRPLVALWVCALMAIPFAAALAQADETAAVERSERAYLQALRHFQLGLRANDAAAARSHFEEALEDFLRAVDEPETYELADHYLGVAYGKLGRHREALPHLRKAVRRYEQAPIVRRGLVPAYQDLAAALYALEKYKESLEVVEKALEKEADNGFLHFAKGLCQYQMKQYPAAISSLRQAMRLEPSLRSRAEYHAGLSFLAQDQLDQAQEALRAAAQAPDSKLAEQAREMSKQIDEARRKSEKRKPWELRLALGAEFDSNVILQAEEEPVFGAITEESDIRFNLAAGAGYAWRGNAGYVRGDYDFHLTRHADIGDFDLQGHQPRLEAAWRATPDLTVGVQGGFNFYRLGGADYLSQLYVRPFAGIFLGAKHYSEAFYRFTDQDFRIDFFDPARDGNVQELGGRHHFLLRGFDRYFFVGYQHIEDDPDSASGNDFQYSGNQIEGGVRWPLWEESFFEGSYSYRGEDYEFPISIDPLNRMREDDAHEVRLAFSRVLAENMELRVEYLGRFNNSTIEFFEYRRNVFSGVIQFIF